jgi:hypothetical protein
MRSARDSKFYWQNFQKLSVKKVTGSFVSAGQGHITATIRFLWTLLTFFPQTKKIGILIFGLEFEPSRSNKSAHNELQRQW